LPAAIEATVEPENMRSGLEASDYWDADEWSVYARPRDDVLAMLRGLQESGFTRWWESAGREPSRSRAAELEPVLADIDIVPMVEKAVGRRLQSGGITLYAARFCRPHGILVTGDRFLLDIVDSRDPLPIAVATAIHEMVHPPFDVEDDRIIRLIERLKQDPFIYGRWESHEPSFGYNTFPGYVDENVTKALDQLIGERVGMTFMADVEERWIRNDDGMHMLAAAVYELMKAEKFLNAGARDPRILRCQGAASSAQDRATSDAAVLPDDVVPISHHWAMVAPGRPGHVGSSRNAGGSVPIWPTSLVPEGAVSGRVVAPRHGGIPDATSSFTGRGRPCGRPPVHRL
jgi:hypothetical protein